MNTAIQLLAEKIDHIIELFGTLEQKIDYQFRLYDAYCEDDDCEDINEYSQLRDRKLHQVPDMETEETLLEQSDEEPTIRNHKRRDKHVKN